jgi:hypothetical protein
MRYRKGSLNLNRFQDKAVLSCVADSCAVTHAQLFQFARLDYYERNRPCSDYSYRSATIGSTFAARRAGT